MNGGATARQGGHKENEPQGGKAAHPARSWGRSSTATPPCEGPRAAYGGGG